MAEEKKKPRPGQKKLMDKLGKSRDANANKRARSKADKPSGGTLTERAKKIKKPAGGPPEKKNVPALRSTTEPAVRKDNVPSVNRSGKGDIVRYKGGNLPAKPGGGSSGGASGIGGTIARGLYRTVGGPAVMLASMTTPAGEGSDKPKGPLMKGGRTPGYDYGPRKDPEPKNPNRGLGASVKRDMEAPAAPKPKARPAAKPAAKAPERKTFAKKDDKPKFRGNWVGAAPTAMQARAGMRTPPKVKRTGSMRDK